MSFTCEYCSKIYSTKGSLTRHQRTAKYCLKLQNKNLEKVYNCNHCKYYTGRDNDLTTHIKTCKSKKKKELKESKDDKLQLALNKQHIKTQEGIIKELKKEAFKPKTTKETFIDIKQEEIEEENVYKLTPLEISDGYTIEHREEDSYINVTNLCKAGQMKFKDWNRLEKTIAFLSVLSSSTLINTNELIKYVISSNKIRSTWVHPHVAINIAQWVSPILDVKVSAWVYEVMMTGKMDILNTNTYRQLQEENKTKDLKIRILTNKYIKSQPRKQYKEEYVVYILTTKLLKTERRYVLGKAKNLTNRLSTYNKTDEHQVVYYQECKDKEHMSLVEQLVFSKLKMYREQANRERFVLPKDKKIQLFIDTVKDCINFI
jgi:hypothetical protein